MDRIEQHCELPTCSHSVLIDPAQMLACNNCLKAFYREHLRLAPIYHPDWSFRSDHFHRRVCTACLEVLMQAYYVEKLSS